MTRTAEILIAELRSAIDAADSGDVRGVLDRLARRRGLRVVRPSPGPTPRDDSEALAKITEHLARGVPISTAINSVRIDLGADRAAMRRWRLKISRR
jgi:hypothetical protein